MPSRNVVLITVGIVTIISGAIGGYFLMKNNENSNGLSGNDASILDKKTLDGLPIKTASSADLTRLASDIKPPTNSWISGMVLQAKPLAVFPMPLSFQASDVGFQVGLPEVTSDARTITGGHTPGVEANINNATGYKLTRFDKTSATLTYFNKETELGKLTIAQGSPYVFYRAEHDSELVMANASGGKMEGQSYSYEKNGKRYVLAANGKASLKQAGATARVTVPAGELLTIYALPSASANDTLKEYAGNEITSIQVKNEVKDNAALTIFEYKTANNKPTLFSALPYQTIVDGSETDVSFQSIYGDMKTYRGNNFTVSAPLIIPSNELDLKALSGSEKQAVIEDLKKDSQDLKVEPQDTYFAGKYLARLATLLSLAEQLNEKDTAQSLRAGLKEELTKRLGGEYLYYDSELKGIAGQTAAFGSEDFNDHHFHYGYFIYAASILAKYDAEFLNEYKNSVNLLVADIASYETYEEFPVQRNYEPYSGHAWAAGLSPFQDGNNQESSSEALNAWNAVALWGDVIGNKTLQQTGQWMLSNETATADKAWRNVDMSASYLSNYSSPVASLSFGGKRTYATFFSDESNTKLAIQLIPMSPVMQTFASDGDAITKKLAAQGKPGDYNVALGDYLIMYLALRDPKAAEDALNRQTDEFIDDGNSRAYLRAWIYSQK